MAWWWLSPPSIHSSLPRFDLILLNDKLPTTFSGMVLHFRRGRVLNYGWQFLVLNSYTYPCWIRTNHCRALQLLLAHSPPSSTSLLTLVSAKCFSQPLLYRCVHRKCDRPPPKSKCSSHPSAITYHEMHLLPDTSTLSRQSDKADWYDQASALERKSRTPIHLRAHPQQLEMAREPPILNFHPA